MRRALGAIIGLSSGYVIALMIPTNHGLAIAAFVGTILGVSIATWE